MGNSPPSKAFCTEKPVQVKKESSVKSTFPQHYIISSLFLHRCHRYLTRNLSEEIHLVTGVRQNSYFVLDEMIKLPHAEKSITGAFSDQAEIRRSLVFIDNFGLECGGMFHSHPGQGQGSVSPSGTDVRNQETWEQAFGMIGGIFSKDGYVRFFTRSRKARVEVQGKKVRKINENLFKLEID